MRVRTTLQHDLNSDSACCAQRLQAASLPPAHAIVDNETRPRLNHCHLQSRKRWIERCVNGFDLILFRFILYSLRRRTRLPVE